MQPQGVAHGPGRHQSNPAATVAFRQRLWRSVVVGVIVWFGAPLLFWLSVLLLAVFGRVLIPSP
jgi:hypothetical protein